MICLAKRVKEKWIKAWRDQRNATIKSRQLPWDQQEMHIIYKLFFWLLSDVEGIDCYCLEDELLLEGRGSQVIITQREERIFSPVLNSSLLWSVSEATAESTYNRWQQAARRLWQPHKYLTDGLNICSAPNSVGGYGSCRCLNGKSNRLKLLTRDFQFFHHVSNSNKGCWSTILGNNVLIKN